MRAVLPSTAATSHRRPIMLSRREFLAAAASAAFAARGKAAAAADGYDLVVRGGRVIDPAARLDAVRDVGIRGGRIAAVAPRIPEQAANVLDARGKIVAPGLIDIHTHGA